MVDGIEGIGKGDVLFGDHREVSDVAGGAIDRAEYRAGARREVCR